MKSPDNNTKAKKILLAMDIASQSLAARDIALSLAARLEAELIGLIVEDEDLLTSAQFPFASEIIASSATERKLDYADMERSIRAWSSQMQRQLAEQAQQINIKCSFRTFRGRKTETLLAQTETYSLLVFSGLRISHYPSHDIAHTVYLLVDDNSNLNHSLTIAKQLISEGINHIVLVDSGADTSRQKVSNAFDILSKTNTHIHTKKLDDHLSQDLAAIIEHFPAVLILVPAEHNICQQRGEFNELQRNVSCPVVVVN